MKLVLALCLTLSCFSVALAKSQTLKPFSVRLELPSISQGCLSNASEIGKRFAVITGLSVTDATCTNTRTLLENGVRYSLDTIIVSYSSDKEVNPVYAVFGGSDTVSNPQPEVAVFATYRDCLAQSALQNTNFQKETELPVFVSYCQFASGGITDGYTLIIQSYGQAKRQLYVYKSGDLYQNLNTRVTDAALFAIKSDGGHVVLNLNGQIFYYREYGTNVLSSDVVRVMNESQCQTQLATASSVASARHMTGVSIFCSGEAPNVYLSVMGVGDLAAYPGSIISVPTAYYSFDACVSDEPRETQNMISNGAKVLGAVCGVKDDNKTFEMNIFVKNF